MVFNPLFLQNTTGLENVHPEKVNKLNSSGYLFSDIINVFMNNEEGEPLTKLTQEFLGSAQIKETNGTPVILDLLGETTIPLTDLTKNLELKIEDFLPAGLKKKLIDVDSSNNKDVKEKSMTATKEQLQQILLAIGNLFKTGSGETGGEDAGGNELVGAADQLDKSDGVFLIVETADKVFNINISKQPGANSAEGKNTKEIDGNLYKIKFTLINEKSLLNAQGSGVLAVNNEQNSSQLSFLPFESELASEITGKSSNVKLKVFSYQNSGSENINSQVQKGAANLNAADGTKVTAEETVALEGGEPVKEVSNKSAANQTSDKVADVNSGKNVNAAEKILKAAGDNKTVVKASESEKSSAGVNKSGNAEENISKDNNVKAAGIQNVKRDNSGAAVAGNKPDVPGKHDVKKNIETNQSNDEAGKNKSAKAADLQNENLKDFKKEFSDVKAETNQHEVKKPAHESKIKEFKDVSEFKFDEKKETSEIKAKDVLEKPVKPSADEKSVKEDFAKNLDKNILENKENEQLNIKVSKAVKHITTVKAENTHHQQNPDKPVKENSDSKVHSTDEKINSVKPETTGEKSFSQNENSFKHQEENKNVPFEASKISSTQAKEKFTLDAPVPNSNSDRIVKVAEIMKEISKFIEKQDKSTLTIKVSPEDLGKLKITLDVNDHNVKANIHVENEVVKTMIEKNIIDLQNQMSKSGIQLTSVNISLSDNEQKNAKQFVNKKKSGSVEINENNTEESEEEKVKMMGYNTVEYLA